MTWIGQTTTDLYSLKFLSAVICPIRVISPSPVLQSYRFCDICVNPPAEDYPTFIARINVKLIRI